jgi:hypothetical protein
MNSGNSHDMDPISEKSLQKLGVSPNVDGLDLSIPPVVTTEQMIDLFIHLFTSKLQFKLITH